jgi:hypothetical protein
MTRKGEPVVSKSGMQCRAVHYCKEVKELSYEKNGRDTRQQPSELRAHHTSTSTSTSTRRSSGPSMGMIIITIIIQAWQSIRQAIFRADSSSSSSSSTEGRDVAKH